VNGEGVEVDVPEDNPAVNRRHVPAFIEMLISSLLSLTASLVLSIEAINIAAHPQAKAFCDISASISCTAVAKQWQSSLLGFPNAFLGLIAEPVVITVAVAALGGVRFPRWFMLTAQGVYTIGFAFAYWLFYESYFVIHRLCPWCLLVTATTTLVFMSMTRVNILDGNLRLLRRTVPWVRAGVDHGVAVILLVTMAAMIYLRYI
jgi:uncharacterized membrane protein